MFDYKDYDFENYTLVKEGNDGFVYGNYIDFPRFRQDYEEELLLDAGADIPFGKNMYIEEYIDIIYNLRHLVNGYIFDKLKEQIFSGDFSFDNHSVVKFIDRDNNLSDELVNYILDNYGVPNDYVYEHDLPDYLKYWYDEDYDQELLDYLLAPIEFDYYKREVENIFKLIDQESNEITMKSLILSSLVFAESLLKSIITKGLPKDDGISLFYKEIISDKIDKDLKYYNSRNALFKKIYGEKVPEQNWIDLRNSLAHDIGKASIDGNLIKFYNMKHKKDDVYDIGQLKTDLIEFGNNINSIIYEN